ncbi:MAG: hypothetical protein LBO07_06845 [Coriobacteriales bacterium]|jgi:hypothetical protein|nr:hypothetical protein [Coriobacteriales bacterium]
MTTENRPASAGTTDATDATDAAGTTGTTDATASAGATNAANATNATNAANVTRKAGGIRGAFIWHMRVMGQSTLWFLGIMLLVVTVINVGFVSFSIIPYPAEPLIYPSAIAAASNVFLLVMGFVMPSYLESALSFGLTRQQHALALLLCGLAIAGGLALICVLLALPLSQFDLLQSVRFFLPFIHSWFFFLVGWLIVIGYQYRRIVTAILSTLLGIAVLAFGSFWIEWLRMSPLAVDDTSVLHLQPLLQAVEFGGVYLGILNLAITIVLIIILMPTVIALTRRISIKV